MTSATEPTTIETLKSALAVVSAARARAEELRADIEAKREAREAVSAQATATRPATGARSELRCDCTLHVWAAPWGKLVGRTE
jgi:membrane protein involved in colicin uptake